MAFPYPRLAQEYKTRNLRNRVKSDKVGVQGLRQWSCWLLQVSTIGKTNLPIPGAPESFPVVHEFGHPSFPGCSCSMVFFQKTVHTVHMVSDQEHWSNQLRILTDEKSIDPQRLHRGRQGVTVEDQVHPFDHIGRDVDKVPLVLDGDQCATGAVFHGNV